MTFPEHAARHARQRNTSRAAARNRQAAQAYTPPAPQRRASGTVFHAGRRQSRGRSNWRATRLLPGQPTGTAGKLLAAELMMGFAIVLIRALGDYQLTDSGTARGTLSAPGNGGYGPFTVLAGLIGSFFGLSFLAAEGGKRAKWATAFGALIVIVLTMKSMDEIQTVAGFVTADPATRTVTAASWSSGAAQPWGAAAATSSAQGFYGGTFTSTASGGDTSGTAGSSASDSGTQAGGSVVNNAHTES